MYLLKKFVINNHLAFIFKLIRSLDIELQTCTRASLKFSLIASSSRVNTSGYCVFSNALSSWCNWYVVKVVLDLRIFLGLSGSFSGSSMEPLQDPESSPPFKSLLSRSGFPESSSLDVISGPMTSLPGWFPRWRIGLPFCRKLWLGLVEATLGWRKRWFGLVENPLTLSLGPKRGLLMWWFWLLGVMVQQYSGCLWHIWLHRATESVELPLAICFGHQEA